MKEKLEELLKNGETIRKCSAHSLANKTAPDKWSKKEILGHLIDSAINNLQRFTEIQFKEKPYLIRNYNQDELVKVNNYQNAEINDLLNLWLALNKRIGSVIELQKKENLKYQVLFEDGGSSDLRFLISDYLDHMDHHLKQILVD